MDAAVKASVMAADLFSTLHEAAAQVEREDGEVTQGELIYALWCTLTTHIIHQGRPGEALAESVLYVERLYHNQERPS